MADDDDKTEEATGQKLSKAREEGNVAKSMDLTNGAMTCAALVALWIFGPRLINGMQENMRATFSLIHTFKFSDANFVQLLVDQTVHILQLTYPILLILVVVGVVANLSQFGFLWSEKKLQPKFSNVFSMQKLAMLFNSNAWVELLKGLLKLSAIGLMSYYVISSKYEQIIVLSDSDSKEIIAFLWDACFELMLYIALLILFLGFGDLIYQRLKFKKKMKMSKQEVKDEWKNSEGDPKLKQKIRQKMMEMSRRQMIQDVPSATVVVTNPTFLAIALRYERGKDDAPMVLAKGKRLIAQQIRDQATEAGVAIVENKPLARGMYDLAEVGEPIPAEFFSAVAEVLAFVFSQEARR